MHLCAGGAARGPSMSSTVFESIPGIRNFIRRLCCGTAAVAVVLGIAACGGGGGGAGNATTDMSQPQAPQDQVVAVLLAQQSVTRSAAPAPLSPQASSGNLVANGNFESGMANWANWGNASVVAGQGSSGTSAFAVGTGAG